ncbi:MAG TPA: hypothetical protein VF516_08270 [Kofleriaceae bacterium]
MKRKPLHVSLHARESSVVELTVGDRVQLDRLTPSPHGQLAERHGRLLDPGVHTVALEPGRYFFKTLSDANLRVVTGGVAAGITAETKDGGSPDPPKAMGDEAPGELPSLTIERA